MVWVGRPVLGFAACSPPFPGGEFGLVPLFQVDGIDSGGVKDQS